jgi:hypothetical protein
VVVENGIPKARLAIYFNPDLHYDGKFSACFGKYECVNEDEVSKLILNHTLGYCKENGAEFVIGPMNGSTWEDYRFSLNHDFPNFFLEPYHHLYYNEQFAGFGFKPIANYHSLKDTTLEFKIPGIHELKTKFESKGVTFRNVDLINFQEDLTAIFELNEIAFQSNFLYTPIDKLDFFNKYLGAKNFIDPEFMILAFDRSKKLIAYYFCVEDYYCKSDKCLIFKSIARNPDKEWKKLGQVIGLQMYDKARAKGFHSIIHAFMYDNGTSSPISEKFSDNRFKKYRLYGIEV